MSVHGSGIKIFLSFFKLFFKFIGNIKHCLALNFSSNFLKIVSTSSLSSFRNITLCYKDIPIHRFSSQEFEFGEGDIGLFKSAILESVDEDGDFIKNILSNQPKSKLEALCSTFPEMTKFLK